MVRIVVAPKSRDVVELTAFEGVLQHDGDRELAVVEVPAKLVAECCTIARGSSTAASSGIGSKYTL